MSNRRLDVLFVQPNSRVIYQGLRGKFSAVEPPTWALLLAQSVRAAGFGAQILDCDALDLADDEAVAQVKIFDPRLVVFVAYGSEPNQGTTRMASALPVARFLKAEYPEFKVCFVGTHAQAEPLEVLNEPGVDFVLLNEGVYALRDLLATDLGNDLWHVKGVGWRPWGAKAYPVLNDPAPAVPQDLMERDLPGYAWDLLYPNTDPLKRYRSHFWHGEYKHEDRTPFAAIYTSLGCPFKCSFCCINAINRASNDKGYTTADSAVFRYWPAEHTLKQIEWLVDRGVTTIRFSDEMFFLNPKHYEPILNGIRERWGDRLNLWSYARVDTVRPKFLDLFRSAGVRWLCLGIEAGNTAVRAEAHKGSFVNVDVRDVVKQVEDAGIDVIANFIVGLENDTYETMWATRTLATELNTRMMNVYPAMALPGTPLYQKAKQQGWALPDTHAGYGFLSYECRPLGTETCSPADVVRFRDEMFTAYWSRPEFQTRVGDKFGPAAVENIKDMLKVRLKRKLLGD